MCVVCEHMYEQARVCGDPHTHTLHVRFGVSACVCGAQYTFQVRNQELHLGAECGSCHNTNKF